MPLEHEQTRIGSTTEPPPGYRVLNDGPGCEVLMREEWEECPVFTTQAEAVAWAWTQHEDYADG